MKNRFILASLLALGIGSAAFAQEASKPQLKLYGFIRNYFAYDTRESVAGTEDFFYWVPKDESIQNGMDVNAVHSFRFAALTSRVGLDVTGYQVQGWNLGAKIEADFYAGVSGVTGTATLRLRQAYLTMAKNAVSLKIGQAWHPMAADMPDVFSLNTGAPFGPFSRTPLVSADFKLSNDFSLTAAAIWQMQYTSAGPNGAKADYIKYGRTPEIYLGLNYKSADGLIARIGVDLLSIKPRVYNTNNGTSAGATKKVSDRITTFSPFAYLQYSKGLFSVKAKTIFAQSGEHFGLNGGYGVKAEGFDINGDWNYSPSRNSSSWVSLAYGSKVKGILFGGYVKNFGTKEEVLMDRYYFSKNSFANLNSMWRLTPTVLYNLGKLQLGLEYEITSVQYGSVDGTKPYFGLATKDLHWVTNHRVQMMVKYTF